LTVEDYIAPNQFSVHLEVIADDPAAYEDLQRWAKNTGNELIELRKEGFEVIALIKKK